MTRTVTTREAAVLLGVSEQTVRRYITDGTIPAIRLQDDAWYRIECNALEEWAMSRGMRLDWSLIERRQQ
jgi:excisionase family DNA binding protein